MKLDEKRDLVCVTGATTGIGLALAKALTAAGYPVLLTARESSLSRFQEAGIFPGTGILIRPLDVRDTQACDALITEVEAMGRRIAVLINNAGICYRAVVEHLDPAAQHHQFEVNYFGPCYLMKKVIPSMRRMGSGHIINLSSVGGMMAMPTMGAYSGSKFALEGISESLWYEMRPWGVHVSLIEPGFVHSNSFQNAAFTDESRYAFEHEGELYHPYYKHLIRFIGKMMMRSPTRPEDIARRMVRLLSQKRPPLRVPVTWDAYIFRFLRRWLPSRFYHWFLYRSLPHIDAWAEGKDKD